MDELHADESVSHHSVASMPRRCIAWFLDDVFVSLLAGGAGIVLEDPLARTWGSAAFLTVMLQVLYAGILQSSLGGGRTPGQLLLRIRVVDRDGLPLRPGASLLRALVFFGPSVCDSPLSILGPTFAGLFILLNAPARQGLHDLAAGAFVVQNGSGPVLERTPAWKPGVAIALVLLLGVAVTLIPPPTTPLGKLMSIPGMREVAFEKDEDTPSGSKTTVGFRLSPPGLNAPLDYRGATVMGFMAEHLVPRPSKPTSVRLQLVSQGPTEDDSAQMRAAALTALRDPLVAAASHLTIELQHEWSMGIFSRQETRSVTRTPAEWLATQP